MRFRVFFSFRDGCERMLQHEVRIAWWTDAQEGHVRVYSTSTSPIKNEECDKLIKVETFKRQSIWTKNEMSNSSCLCPENQLKSNNK